MGNSDFWNGQDIKGSLVSPEFVGVVVGFGGAVLVTTGAAFEFFGNSGSGELMLLVGAITAFSGLFLFMVRQWKYCAKNKVGEFRVVYDLVNQDGGRLGEL